MMKITLTDSWLKPYNRKIEKRSARYRAVKERLTAGTMLKDFACGHLYYGVQREGNLRVIREWAPNADSIYLISGLTGWKPDESFRFEKISEFGDWEIKISGDILKHGDLYKLFIKWGSGSGERIPSYAERVVQDEHTKIFSAQIWDPPEKYSWKHSFITDSNQPMLIYEAHPGMAQEERKVGTFYEFEKNVLPRIADTGYNAIQMMALMEHPYYGSFGYQVSNFYALSSRFGTPEDFKRVVDKCHSLGISVIMDLVHSHAVKNENEGLGLFDGTDYQYFHKGKKGHHPAWDSRLFNYTNEKVLHYLLSNCAFWLTEYNLDGFRFDGVTSMLYRDHGLGREFTDYSDYFSDNFDEEAAAYLVLANELVHQLKPSAVTIAEDMSGYPGTAFETEGGGLGFDYRLAMGIPDYWIKTIKEKRDEEWNVQDIWFQLNNRRKNEKNIAYSESHDQALVGDKTLAFLMMDSHMYDSMNIGSKNLVIERGVALHKIIRLLTFSLGGDAYLTFMGNEFGHPDWIDFPREGNGWSYAHARRQWKLADDCTLRYCLLNAFEKGMLSACAEVLNYKNAEKIRIDNKDQLISYRRGDLYFCVNINPSVSFTDYRLVVPKGLYSLILNTDSPDYNGFGRVPDSLVLETGNQENHDYITPYLPSRTALVFRRLTDRDQ